MTEFEELYRTYFDDVFRYIRRLSGSESIADEITSETFFKAMRSIKSFRGNCDIRVWLCQIAKNCYYTYLKKSTQTDSIDETELSELPSEAVSYTHLFQLFQNIVGRIISDVVIIDRHIQYLMKYLSLIHI